MKKQKFSEAQILKAIKEYEAGKNVMKFIERLFPNAKIKRLIITITFYLLSLLLAGLFELLVKGDMCNPGLGVIFIIMILPLIIVGLIFWNFKQLAQGKKEHLYSFWFHIILLAVAFIGIRFRLFI